jgi:predicted SAM-dependent methyltransferase
MFRKAGYVIIRTEGDTDGTHHASDESNRLREVSGSYVQKKLHIGCGPRVISGWINIDLKYQLYSSQHEKYLLKTFPAQFRLEPRGTRSDFFEMNILDIGIPLAENSVDLIFHEDFIEHLDQKEQIIFLSECLRVLKPGCVHRINTPDLLQCMRKKSNFIGGMRGVNTDEWSRHGHKNIFSRTTLEEVAKLVGYSEVKFNGRNQSSSELVPKEFRPMPGDRPEEGNLFADLRK